MICVVRPKQCVTPKLALCVPRQRPKHTTMPMLLLEQCIQRQSLNCNVHGRHNHQPSTWEPNIEFFDVLSDSGFPMLDDTPSVLVLTGIVELIVDELCFPDKHCCDTRLNVLDLALTVGESSVEKLSCDLFDMATLCFRFGTKKWLHVNVVLLMTLNRCNRWFPSSHVKSPFVKMSASWLFGSTYLIWIFGSKLIMSNNQSNAPLCVLDTCLIVGLLALMIIFITASLSSKMYSCDLFSEWCVFEGTRSMFESSTFDTWPILVGFSWEASGFPLHAWGSLEISCVALNTSITKSHSSSAGKPSIRKPASSEIITDSVELWDTEVCFLHIPLIGTHVLLPKMHKTLLVWTPAKSESWKSPDRQCCAVLPTWKYWRWSLVWWMLEINRANRLSQDCDHFVTDLPSLLTDHRLSGRPILAKYKHFKNYVSKLVTIHQYFPSLLSLFCDHPSKD